MSVRFSPGLNGIVEPPATWATPFNRDRRVTLDRSDTQPLPLSDRQFMPLSLSPRFRRRPQRPWLRPRLAPVRLTDDVTASSLPPNAADGSIDHPNDAPLLVVQHNVGAQRFEARIANTVAELPYRCDENGTLALFDVVAPPSPLGARAARRLMRAALEFARGSRLTVIPLSPFAAAYLSRHPEFRNLLRSRDPIGRQFW